MAENKKWIQNAVPESHKGLLHEKLGVPEGEKIPEKKLANAKSKGGTIAKEAQFAENMKGLHKKKGFISTDELREHFKKKYGNK